MVRPGLGLIFRAVYKRRLGDLLVGKSCVVALGLLKWNHDNVPDDILPTLR